MIEAKSTESNETLSEVSLESLIAKIASGDRQAMSAIFGETKTAVYGFVLSILKNSNDAEDVLQETYVKIWSTAERYKPMGKPMAWILTIAKNLSLSLLREKSKQADMPEENQLEDQSVSFSASTEDSIVLNAAMNKLSDEERQIVVLHAITGLKHVEIARLLSLPLSTVLSKYSRAKRKLKNILEEE